MEKAKLNIIFFDQSDVIATSGTACANFEHFGKEVSHYYIDNYNKETKKYGFYVYGTDEYGNFEASYGGENYFTNEFTGVTVTVGKWYYQNKGTLTEDTDVH